MLHTLSIVKSNTTDSISPTYDVVPNYNKKKNSHHESNRTSRDPETWNMDNFLVRSTRTRLIPFKRYQNISVSLQLRFALFRFALLLLWSCSRHATCHALFCISSPCSPRLPMATNTCKTKINLAINDIYQSCLFFFKHSSVVKIFFSRRRLAFGLRSLETAQIDRPTTLRC